MSGKPAVRRTGKPVWISGPVAARLEALRAERQAQLERTVTLTEVIEQLLDTAEKP
jgi:hypothetical protein